MKYTWNNKSKFISKLIFTVIAVSGRFLCKTKYCNYSKDKFGKELTFIKPSWWKEEDNEVATLYIQPWRNIENCYLTLIENGIKPQDARAILPNALKTEVVMTGFESDWDHFLNSDALKLLIQICRNQLMN